MCRQSMDTFGRRPNLPIPRPGVVNLILPATAHGHCYLAWQCLLVFGRDRGEPVGSRPVVSLLKERHRLYVLPATTKSNDALLCIDLNCCGVEDSKNQSDYSYLSHQPELVNGTSLKELGTLTADLRQDIAAWLRNRHLGAAL